MMATKVELEAEISRHEAMIAFTGGLLRTAKRELVELNAMVKFGDVLCFKCAYSDDRYRVALFDAKGNLSTYDKNGKRVGSASSRYYTKTGQNIFSGEGIALEGELE